MCGDVTEAAASTPNPSGDVAAITVSAAFWVSRLYASSFLGFGDFSWEMSGYSSIGGTPRGFLLRLLCIILSATLFTLCLLNFLGGFLQLDGVQWDRRSHRRVETTERQSFRTVETLRLDEEPTPKPEEEGCGNRTAELIAEIRWKQTAATANWTFEHPALWDRWNVMADFFGPKMNDYKHSFRPFAYLADGEFKHWLELRDRRASCNMVTVGVGEVWDGERLVRKKYPQCDLLGIDPGESKNRPLVESMPRSRFVHAAVSDADLNDQRLYAKDNGTYSHRSGRVRSFVDVLQKENENRTIDYLSMDAEGAEFALIPLLHRQRHRLPLICQLNVELHFAEQQYGHRLEDFMETFRGFMAEAHYVLMDTDVYDHLPLNSSFAFIMFRIPVMMRRLFFVNVVDRECVEKFLCDAE